MLRLSTLALLACSTPVARARDQRLLPPPARTDPAPGRRLHRRNRHRRQRGLRRQGHGRASAGRRRPLARRPRPHRRHRPPDADRRGRRAATRPVRRARGQHPRRTLRDPNDLWFGLTSRARIVYASKDRVAPGEVTTYEDLASDKWKGRLCTRSGLHDYNVALLGAIIAHHDEADCHHLGRGAESQPRPEARRRRPRPGQGHRGRRMRHRPRQHLLHGPDAGRPRTGGLAPKASTSSSRPSRTAAPT